MGYFHKSNGYVTIEDDGTGFKTAFDAVKSTELFGRASMEFNRSGNKMTISIDVYDKYYEEEYYDLFNVLSKWTSDGYIECSGEDDTFWRFIYDPEKGAWNEESGSIAYELWVLVTAKDDDIRIEQFASECDAFMAMKEEWERAVAQIAPFTAELSLSETDACLCLESGETLRWKIQKIDV